MVAALERGIWKWISLGASILLIAGAVAVTRKVGAPAGNQAEAAPSGAASDAPVASVRYTGPIVLSRYSEGVRMIAGPVLRSYKVQGTKKGYLSAASVFDGLQRVHEYGKLDLSDTNELMEHLSMADLDGELNFGEARELVAHARRILKSKKID